MKRPDPIRLLAEISFLSILAIAFLPRCGEVDYPASGFICMNGTDAECELVRKAEEAYDRCNVLPPYTEFWFWHKGDAECGEFAPNWCGFKVHGSPTAYIDRCKTDVCTNVVKYVVHEPLHFYWLDEEKVVAETKRIIDNCWEKPCDEDSCLQKEKL